MPPDPKPPTVEELVREAKATIDHVYRCLLAAQLGTADMKRERDEARGERDALRRKYEPSAT